MSDNIDLILGRRLKSRRRLLGLTQQALAGRCGVTFQQIQKDESAATRISATMLWKLARALEVEVDYFFAGLGHDESQDRRLPAPERLRIAV